MHSTACKKKLHKYQTIKVTDMVKFHICIHCVVVNEGLSSLKAILMKGCNPISRTFYGGNLQGIVKKMAK